MEESSAGPFAEFPEEVQDAIDGLLVLGHLEKEIEWCGHTFVIRTLKAGEELQASALSKEYLESFGQVLAYAMSNIALSLVSVDGDENFCNPLGPGDKAYARSRFNYVADWYGPQSNTFYDVLKSLEIFRKRLWKP